MKKVYTILDKVMQKSGDLFTADCDVLALRNCRNMIEYQKLQHPEEFALYIVGSYDDDLVSICPSKVKICDLDEVTEKMNSLELNDSNDEKEIF